MYLYTLVVVVFVMASKKSTKKKSDSSKSGADIEGSIERGIERGIEGTVEKLVSKHISSCKSHSCSCTHTGGWFYFLGFIGAAIFYISNTSGFWNVILALLKAMVWPVFVVLKLLGL